jgi:hypothetical protein
MKHLLTGALFILILAGCSKNSSDNTPPIDPNKKYTISYEVNDQIVKTSVTNDTLHLDMYEKLYFIVDPTEYAYSWALHLQENFSSSYLNNLGYTCLSDQGVFAYDFRSENLNHVHSTQKSVSDVTINGKNYKKVRLERTIQFFSVFPNNPTAAAAKQNELVATTNQTVTFSSFYVYNDVSSSPNTTTAKLVYTK